MKYLAILVTVLLVGCGQSHTQIVYVEKPAESTPVYRDGCEIDASSKLVNEHNVSDISNLVKNKKDFGDHGVCDVKFDLAVDGQNYHLEEHEEGLEQLESLCYYAEKRAREHLLLDLGGRFKSESNISCRHHEDG